MKRYVCSVSAIAISGVVAALTMASALAGSVKSEAFGSTKDGKAVELYTLTNDQGSLVKFMTLAASSPRSMCLTAGAGWATWSWASRR
jgi:hypothetical protein